MQYQYLWREHFTACLSFAHNPAVYSVPGLPATSMLSPQIRQGLAAPPPQIRQASPAAPPKIRQALAAPRLRFPMAMVPPSLPTLPWATAGRMPCASRTVLTQPHRHRRRPRIKMARATACTAVPPAPSIASVLPRPPVAVASWQTGCRNPSTRFVPLHCRTHTHTQTCIHTHTHTQTHLRTHTRRMFGEGRGWGVATL